ncbi:MAG: hypothetical protein ABIS47_00220, partial [Acidimicrobiales bacterium]
MGESDLPVWVHAATAAAVRLAAEAGTEVDEAFGQSGPVAARSGRMTQQAIRLEQSADLTEVATDLAGLLWAECEDVPRIATILEEPATQAALEAVAEARRRAAQRLAAAVPPDAPAPAPAWRRIAPPEPSPVGIFGRSGVAPARAAGSSPPVATALADRGPPASARRPRPRHCATMAGWARAIFR